MGAKKLDKFGGLLPAWEAHLIPDGQATTASNAYLFSGALNGWRTPTLLRQLNNSAAKFVYRIPTLTEAIALASIVFLSNPLPGDFAFIGELSYVFVNAQAGLPLGDAVPIAIGAIVYVLIGPTSTFTAFNFLNAVTFDDGLGTNQGLTYSRYSYANPSVATPNTIPGVHDGIYRNPITGQLSALGPAVVFAAPDFGAAYNNTGVGESTSRVRMTWLSDPNILSSQINTFTGGINPTFDPTITGPSTFLEFTDPDTNVVKSQVVNDQFKRYYIASPSVQPLYNTTQRILAGQPAFDLGINPPQCAPFVVIDGGGNTGQLGVVTSTGGSTTAGANTVYLYPITPTGAIQINDVTVVGTVADSEANWQAVIYNDIGLGSSSTPSAPGAILGSSVVVSGWLAGDNTADFTNPPGLDKGTPYWIGFMLDTSESTEVGDGVTPMYKFTQTFSNGFPATASAVTVASPNFQMWMDFQTSDIIEARAYVYTWISAYGEESAPSPYTLLNGWSNASWTVYIFPPPFDDLGVTRNLAVARIYRTVTGTSGLTTYYQVADISLGSLDPDAGLFVTNDTGCLPLDNHIVDTTLDDVIALNIQLPSTNFFPPPADLLGFIELPNGVIAAWKNNEVWFCEPYFPHAWPPGYVVAVDFPVVGLGATIGTVVACTSSHSYIVSGGVPGAMNLFRCPKAEPCISRGSIVSLESGVYYVSPNGLIIVPNSGQLRNLTQSWIKREDWDALVPQKNLRAVTLATTYFCWGTTNGTDTSVAQIGFNIALDTDDASSFTVWPQPGGHRLGFMPMTSPLNFNIDNLFLDPWTGQAVMIMNQQEYWYDFTNPAPIIQIYNWKSKKYQEAAKKNYSAMRIYFTVPPGTPTQYQGVNEKPAYDPSWNTLQPGQWGIIKIWADPQQTGANTGQMTLVMARELRKNGQVMRLPDGFKAENWQVEVLARVVISNIQLATSVQELGQV